MPDTADNDEKILSQYSNQKPTASETQKLDEDYSPLDLVGKKFQMGQEGVANSRSNAYAMFRTDLSDDDELKMINAGASKVGPGFSQSAYEAQPWYLRAVDDAAQVLPGIGDSYLQGGIGGAAAVGAGTPLLAPLAGAVGAVNPAAGAVVGGLGAGGLFDAGFTAGSAKSIWEQSAGELYGDLRTSGVNRNTARTLAFTFGSLNASLEYIGLHSLKNVAGRFMGSAHKQAIQKTLNTPFVKQIEQNMVSRLGMKVLENTATETTTEGAQQTSTELAKVVAGMIQKGKADSFTNWSSGTQHVKESMLQAIGASAILGLGAAGVGHGAGVVTGEVGSKTQKIQAEVLNQLEGKSPQELLSLMNEGLQKMPMGNETPEQQKASVQYDEKGTPYIKAGATEVQKTAPPQTTMNLPNRPIEAGQAWVDKLGQTKLADIIADPQATIDEGLQAIYPQETPVSADQADGTQLRMPLVEWRDLNPTETQARQDQIHSDIRVLKKEEANLQDQITVAEKTGKESQKLIQKWRGVTNAIDELTSESEVLDSGLTATTDQQANNFGKMRMKKLNKIFDKMTDTVNKLEQQKSKTTEAGEIGFKKGAFKTERQIKRIQADLKNVVNVVTKDPEIRAKVRQYIAGVTTPEQAKKAIQSIKENALKFEQEKFNQGQLDERAKVFDAVQRLISAKATKVSTDKGYPVAQLPQETIEKLNVLRGYMSNEKTLKEAETSFNEQYGDVDINSIPEDAAYDLNLMRKARALYSGDKLSTNVSAAEIAQWVSDGKQLIQQKREALKAKQEQDRAEAKASMQVPETKDVNYVKAAAKRRQIFLNESKAGWSTMRSLYKRIAPKDVASNLADKMSAKIPFTNYLRNKETTTTNFQKTLAAKLEASGSKVSLSQKLVNDTKDNLQLRFRNRKGSFTTITGNRSQFQDLVMKFKDESVHPALTDDKRGNGFTMPGEVPEGESAYEVIHSIMTKDDNTLIDGIMDFYNGDYRAYINAAYKEKHGYDLPMRDNYSPVTRVGYDVKAPYSSEGIQNYSILPGSAKTREESTLAIRPGNPVSDALDHINRWEYFGAMDGKLAEIQNVLTDPTIKEHVESEYGHGTWWMIQNFHDRLIMNDPIPSEAGNTLWGSLKADFTRAVLGGKHLTGALNQAASGTALWANYSPQQILHGILQTALHPVETETEIRKNPDLKDRYKSGASHELHNALNQQGLFATTLSKVFGHEPDAMDVQKHDLINKFMYAGYSAGDAAAARIFGGPIYHIERANGATKEQASATVAKLMNETQQSTLVEETPYYLTNPIVSTLLAPFSQQPTQILNLMDQHVQDFQNRPLTPKSFMKLGYQTAMLWALPGLFTGLVRNAPSLIAAPDDDEDRTKAALYDTLGNAILGPVGSAGMLGDLAQAIWFYAAKPLIGVDETQRTDFMGRTPLSSFIINDIGGALKEWNKLNKEDDPLAALKLDLNDDSKEEIKSALKYSRPVSKIFGVPSLLFNAPLSGIERASDGDYVGAGMALNGWSPGALKERAATDYDPLSSSSLNLKQDDSVYGNIKTYLDTYLSKQKPQKQADTNKLFIDELMKEAEKK
jgi:ribosomal protein S19E (S16A)